MDGLFGTENLLNRRTEPVGVSWEAGLGWEMNPDIINRLAKRTSLRHPLASICYTQGQTFQPKEKGNYSLAVLTNQGNAWTNAAENFETWMEREIHQIVLYKENNLTLQTPTARMGRIQWEPGITELQYLEAEKRDENSG